MRPLGLALIRSRRRRILGVWAVCLRVGPDLIDPRSGQGTMSPSQYGVLHPGPVNQVTSGAGLHPPATPYPNARRACSAVKPAHGSSDWEAARAGGSIGCSQRIDGGV